MKSFIFLLFLSLSAIGYSQGDADLFRFSKTQIYGSSRFEAMGGAFGALGADLSASQINPASFGRFSSSQTYFSLGYLNTKNKVLFQGDETITNRSSFKPNSIGAVFVEDDSDRMSGYQYIQFGLGFNRLQNFNNKFEYSGYQYESLLEAFAASAKGVPWENLYITHPFTSSLAWETYTIDPDGSAGYVAVLNNDGDQFHRRSVETKGGMNEYYISLSGNYMNAIYVGANIGFRTINYEETTNHYEEVTDTTGNDLRSFDYSYNLLTKGNGANLKLGFIYLPRDNFRLGFAFHTPTFYELTDDTRADMTAQFNYGERIVIDSLKPIGNYKYKLRTPPKFVTSAAYVFGTRGCLSMDVEYVNYAWANLRSTNDPQYQDYDFTIENNAAKEILQSAVNIRVGGELVFNSVVFLRGGLRLSSKAYNDKVQVENGWDKTISTGVGYKSGNWVFNLSARKMYLSRNYFAFQGSMAQNKMNQTSITLDFNYFID